MVLLICLPFGMLCEKIALPTLFGYVMTGVLLGPSGLNVLKSMVSLLAPYTSKSDIISVIIVTENKIYHILKFRSRWKQLVNLGYFSFYSLLG